jgi:hypothetical protein
VRSRNLKNEEVMTSVGPQRHEKKWIIFLMYSSQGMKIATHVEVKDK